MTSRPKWEWYCHYCDCDFYVADNCITYYCPDNGSFTLQGSDKVIN